MGNPLKKLLSLFFKTEQEEIASSVPKELNSEEILVVNKDTDLYHMVQRKLTKAADEVNTTKKIQDLEKAVYVLSGRINQLTEEIQKHTEFIVHLSTAYEEVANSFENEHREGKPEPRKKTAGEDLEVFIAGKNKGKTEIN